MENNNSAENTTKGKWFRWGMLVCITAVLTATFFFMQSEAAPEPEAKAKMPPTTVEVSKAFIKASSHEIVTVGTLQANEAVLIRSEVSGRITSLDFAEGRAVKQNHLLFILDQSVLKAELEKAKADLDLHWSDYKRAKALLKDNAISVRERDQAYAQWKLDKANVRLIQAHLDKTVIRAPFDGILGIRQVSMGDFVNAGQDLINLEDISRLKVEFKIPEIHSALVAENQKVMLRSDAFPDKVFEAEVYAINPRIESQARSLVVRAVMDNPEQKLRPGQFVRVALEVGRNENALFVPEQAIVPQPERMFVWKVADGRATMSQVTIGKRENGMVEIQSGLNVGDMVVTGGIQKIGEGAPVKAVQADPGMFASRS